MANWSFKANGYGSTFQTITLGNTMFDESTLVNGKIAPGSQGTFGITIDATGSEVGVNYNVSFTNERNKPKNLVFYYEGEKFNTLQDLEGKLQGTINTTDNPQSVILGVTWIWDYTTGSTDEYEMNDYLDTQDSLQGLEYSFDIIVTGTQVIPR